VDFLTDVTTSGLERALQGLSARQQATAANIANAQTPGYRAQRVTFEDSLASAMNSGDPQSASIDTLDAGTPANITGNTVQLDAEVTDLQKESLQYQAVASAISFKYSLLRTAIGS
jgi:flagellar basal-body rod protein FlgB